MIDNVNQFILIELEGEDHCLSTRDSRLTILKTMEDFLAANFRRRHHSSGQGGNMEETP